jgi:flagellar protein FlgJ
MANSFDISSALAVDVQKVDKLRLLAKKAPDQALKGAARQFEALFMNMLLKNMREATPKEGPFNSEQTRFYTSMLDQQLAQNLSAKGIGLADIMIRQLSRSAAPDTQRPAAAPAANAVLGPQSGAYAPGAYRKAAPLDRLPDNRQSRLSASLLEQRLTQNLSPQGIDNMIRQLSRAVAPNMPQSPAVLAALAANAATASLALREAIPEDGGIDGEQTRFHVSMLEQQLMQNLSPKGIDNMLRQLARTVAPNVPQPFAPVANAALAPQSGDFIPAGARDFVNKVWTYAREASQATGIPAHFVVAQAALESGWGKHEIRRADGSQSFNLFGIKAGRNWSGAVTETVTTEYVNGMPQKAVEKFRAYGSYAEAFQDYANLLVNNPRYAAVLDQQDAAGFARGLQRAGYATDPVYADKLMRIMNGAVLRQSLTVKV